MSHTITREVRLNVDKENKIIIFAKQGETASRFLKVTMIKQGLATPIDSTATAFFSGKREDGNSGTQLATVNEDGTVTVGIFAYLTANAGYVSCDITLIGTNEERLGIMSFMMLVEATSYELPVVPDPDAALIEQVLAEASAHEAAAEAYAEAAAGSAALAATYQVPIKISRTDYEALVAADLDVEGQTYDVYEVS